MQISASKIKSAIDPSLVPKEEWQTACSVIASSLHIALADPKLKAEYEEWKRKRIIKTERKQETTYGSYSKNAD